MKAPLTFNSAKLTDHTIITVIILESMEETVHGNIKLTIFWHTVNSLKQKTPVGFFEHLSTYISFTRKGNKKIIFLWAFLGIFFSLTPSFQKGSTLTVNIQQM